MGKRRFRGHDPAAKARQEYETRRNPSLWGTNDAALTLAQNADVRSIAETRDKTRRVQRFDVFSTIKLSDHQFTAVRRYQADLAESYGVGDRDTNAEKVDGGSGSRELVSSRSLAASDRCDALYTLLSDADMDLLQCLSLPAWVYGTNRNWHLIVKRLRGLIDRDAQASCVKQLAENVRQAYAEIDGMGVRRAA